MAAVAEEKVNVQLARLGGSKEPFEVDLYWTVNTLLDTVAASFEIPKEGMKLLCKGKMLNDAKVRDKTLKSLKIKAKDKIILMNKPQRKKAAAKPAAPATSLSDSISSSAGSNSKSACSVDEKLEKKKTMQEIKAAAEKLAERDNEGYDWSANYYLELTDQNGQKINLPKETRQALTVGLTLHEKGKKFMARQQYKDAVYILQLAFESLSKVPQELLMTVDNYGLLALDIVWSLYLDQNIAELSNAGKWLQIAELGLERAHGKNMSRLKAVRAASGKHSGDFVPEVSLYVRLNILRAYQAFYQIDRNGAHEYLMKAEMDLRKLQISDMDLAMLQSMGYGHKESRRALRFCGGDMDSAIGHIHQKREDARKRRLEEIESQRKRALQRKYGLTQNGKFVDLALLEQLQGMGVEKEIAIEALRQTDNAGEDTLDLVTSPDRKEILAQTLFARYFNDSRLHLIESVLGVLGADNVSEARVRSALFLTYNNVDEAIDMLSTQHDNPQNVVDLDRIEVRFVPYVQRRQEKLRREQLRMQREAEEARKQAELEAAQTEQLQQPEAEEDGQDVAMAEQDEDDAVDDADVGSGAEAKESMEVDDEAKEEPDSGSGGVVQPVKIEAKAMPNPNLGDVNEEPKADITERLVDQFKPIQHKRPNEDDQKIEEHILDDLDNDEESYLDIDLSKEQDALTNLRAMLNSMGGQTHLSLSGADAKQ